MQNTATDHDNESAEPPRGWLNRVGILRIGVMVLVIACLPMVFLSGASGLGWSIIPTYVVPGIVLFMLWALPFDMLMARVFMADKEGAERERYRTIIIFDGLLIIALLTFWGPFFLALLSAL